MRKNAVFSRIDHFHTPRTRGSSSNWKKVDFTAFEQYGKFISVFLIKKGTFSQEFQNFILAYQARKWVKSVQMSNVRFFPTYTYQMSGFDILVAFWHNGTLDINSGLFFEKFVKIFNFFGFQKSIFFQPNAKKRVLGLRKWTIREKTAFLLNFQNF